MADIMHNPPSEPPHLPKEVPHSAPMAKPEAKPDNSIFSGKEGIFKNDFEYKLKTGQGMYEASKRAGLNLTSEQRAEVLKNLPQHLGNYITPEKLKQGVGEMQKQAYAEKDFAKKSIIEKQIKFLKEIGGIK